MSKRTAALGVLLVLALTGCAGAAETTADERTAPVTTESAAPLEAETPTAQPVDDTEAVFLKKFHEIRATMPGETFIPNATDDQLLAAAEEACDRLATGETSDTISLIEGETKNGADYYSDSGAIITAARQSICPA